MSKRQWMTLGLLAACLGGVAVWAFFQFGNDDPTNAIDPNTTSIKLYKAEIVKTYPHDETAFTQGLVYHEGYLYESTGKRGRSTLRKVEIETGKVLKQHDLDRVYFGEGLALVDDQLIQITWEEETAFIYQLSSFAVLKRLKYQGEGWGLAYDGKHVIMSNGTSVLSYRDPQDFREVRKLNVRVEGQSLPLMLNELEMIDGEIYANVFETEQIARISPETGEVVGWIDCSELLTDEDTAHWTMAHFHESVLNGIAYDKEKKRLFVTGKNWPKLFEIRLVPK